MKCCEYLGGKDEENKKENYNKKKNIINNNKFTVHVLLGVYNSADNFNELNDGVIMKLNKIIIIEAR